MPKETSTTEPIPIDSMPMFEALVDRLSEAAKVVGLRNARLNQAGPTASVHLHTACSHAEGRVVGLTEAIQLVVDAVVKANGLEAVAATEEATR